MSTNTVNYSLKKPSQEDFYNVDDQNGNMDIIDSELKKGVKHSQATAAGQFLVSSGAGQFAVKTASEIKPLLGLGNAAYTDITAYATAQQGAKADNAATQTAFNSHLSDYVRQPGYAITSGTANTYTANLNPAPSALIDGMGLVVKIHTANTGASTLNVNGLGAKPIIDSKGRTVQSGKLLNGRIYSLKYDGANFQLQGEGGDIPKLPNLIKNGSFENDFNSWDNNGFQLSGSYPFDGIRALYATHTSQVWWTCSQQIKCNVGDKIYAACRAFATSASYLDSFLIGVVNLAQNAALGDNGLIDPTKLNQWQFLSTLGTATDAGVICELVTCSAGTMWADGVMAFNLTQAFGAGNEPSKQDIDNMINRISRNLFDKSRAKINKGVVYTTGEIVDDPGCICTDYIPIAPNTVYTASNAGHYALYTVNKTYISGSGSLSTTITTPSNAGYIVLNLSNFPVVPPNINTYQFESGSVSTPYDIASCYWWDSDLPLLTSDATATASDIIPGKIAYGLNGLKCIGTSTRKQWTSGTATFIWTSQNNNADELKKYAFTVSGLSFSPTLIFGYCSKYDYSYGFTGVKNAILSIFLGDYRYGWLGTGQGANLIPNPGTDIITYNPDGFTTSLIVRSINANETYNDTIHWWAFE
ncbi:MAG TPA: hypothetical protein VHP38_15830 [Ruminiclostridium sp.]|nr:hypothetical protein [Ruminiclostridium sp.]